MQHWMKLAALILLTSALPAVAEPRHAIAMHGDPALPPDMVSLPYANPDAPKGGALALSTTGGFDSLNPFIRKGRAATGISALTVESLMIRSYDEPFTLYGLLAESVDTDSARTYVEFTLNAAATFSDGSPVTVADVIWSFEKLGKDGHPRYAAAWTKVAGLEQTGERRVKITFNAPDRELPLILALRPILKKAQFDATDFTESSLVPVIGSGPYVVDAVDPGLSIRFRRNPDWWGKDLAVNKGLHNFDSIAWEYFAAGPSVEFEAFKAGSVDLYREMDPMNWANAYDFPAMTDGRVIKTEVTHQRPTGIRGFVFNTRRPIFADWRVREALTLAFNWELINQIQTGGAEPRIQSYFGNSSLSGDMAKPASPAVLAVLDAYKDHLLPGAIEGYALPVTDGTEGNRVNLRKAGALLEEAGWTVNAAGQLADAKGAPFAFEILLPTGSDQTTAIASIYVKALERLGITAKITAIDDAQMKERTTTYDFDMTYYIRALSLSPGNEQTLYWGSKGVTEPGTTNWMGVASPAVDGLIESMLAAETRQDFSISVQALDRVLTSGRYVIPFGHADRSRIAHAARLKFPDRAPIYGDFLGYLPETWWEAVE